MLVLLATTHRVAPGLLTWRAWETLRSAARVLTGSSEHPQLPYLLEAGIPVEVVDADPRSLAEAALSAPVVWVGSPEGDEALLRALGALAVAGDAPEIEVLHGSYDLPGARLLDLVQVMDVLRRDCPWDRKQTHASLAPYLIEESYELVDAIEAEDLTGLREELGDVLMQVAFHAVVAGERAPEDGGFTIDDVAAGIVDKLVRRHPHVFADVSVSGADEVNENWEQIKAAERAAKSEDHSIFDGVAMGQPALSLAAQLWRRAARAQAPAELSSGLGSELGAELFALVARAQEQGLDPEAELRRVARDYRARVETWEQAPPD
ncbi:MazG family protein [Actinomadura scrupuli]|uniref:MazG family protein n=1 Tax=Actinomadura scrupuli TaxID=559629 RepID=UPI003D98B7E2